MGTRGPLPKPNARRRNKRETNGKLRTARPPMPPGLPVEAQREWRRIVPVLEQMGTLTVIDRAVLIRYCVTWADWVDINDLLGKTARLIKGRDGNLVRNPLWLLRKDAGLALDAMAIQLGLTPAARLRTGIEHEPAVAAEASRAGPTALDDYRRALA